MDFEDDGVTLLSKSAPPQGFEHTAPASLLSPSPEPAQRLSALGHAVD